MISVIEYLKLVLTGETTITKKIGGVGYKTTLSKVTNNEHQVTESNCIPCGDYLAKYSHIRRIHYERAKNLADKLIRDSKEKAELHKELQKPLGRFYDRLEQTRTLKL